MAGSAQVSPLRSRGALPPNIQLFPPFVVNTKSQARGVGLPRGPWDTATRLAALSGLAAIAVSSWSRLTVSLMFFPNCTLVGPELCDVTEGLAATSRTTPAQTARRMTLKVRSRPRMAGLPSSCVVGRAIFLGGDIPPELAAVNFPYEDEVQLPKRQPSRPHTRLNWRERHPAR